MSAARLSIARALSASARASLPRAAFARSLPAAARTLSVSHARFGAGQTDPALSSRIQQEIQYEKSSAPAGEPDFLQAFKKDSVWSIKDKDGEDEVALVREFGNEQIRILFSISDLDHQPPPAEEDAEAVEEVPEESYGVRCSVSITKAGGGALTIDTVAQDSQFTIDNISYYSDSSLATSLTADADWARRGLYIGPQFDHLDAAVQAEFENFLAERGIDESLATFVPEYAVWKEQKEYCKWLENVKKFIDA